MGKTAFYDLLFKVTHYHLLQYFSVKELTEVHTGSKGRNRDHSRYGSLIKRRGSVFVFSPLEKTTLPMY